MTNRTARGPDDQDDAPLREAMRSALREEAAAAAAPSLALQQRVLAQWQLRHRTQAAPQALLAGDGGASLGPRPGGGDTPRHRSRLWLLLGGLAISAALLGWQRARDEAALAELLQPDVLSQMALGEL